VREQSGLLDHVPDTAAQDRRVGLPDVLAVEQDPAAGRLDHPVDHAQRCGLAAARWAHEHRDPAGGDVQVEVAQHRGAIREPLGHFLEFNQGASSSAANT
jgi:hypothetical protein